MYIIWHGQSFFEFIIRGRDNGEVKMAIDPYDKSIGLRLPKVSADILLVSHQHKDHNNISAVLGKPFIIDGPGEYEIKDVFIKGIPAFHDEAEGKERGGVVMYKIEAEDIKLAHLSDLGQRELTDSQLEALGEVDALILPVGSSHSLDAKGAANIISQIEPRLVIPMHYKIPKLKIALEPVSKFLKTMGAEGAKPEKKLKLTPKTLPAEETKIIVLEP